MSEMANETGENQHGTLGEADGLGGTVEEPEPATAIKGTSTSTGGEELADAE